MLFNRICPLIPSGWYDQERLNYCTLYDAQWKDVVNLAAKTVSPSTAEFNAHDVNRQIQGVSSGDTAWPMANSPKRWRRWPRASFPTRPTMSSPASLTNIAATPAASLFFTPWVGMKKTTAARPAKLSSTLRKATGSGRIPPWSLESQSQDQNAQMQASESVFSRKSIHSDGTARRDCHYRRFGLAPLAGALQGQEPGPFHDLQEPSAPDGAGFAIVCKRSREQVAVLHQPC